MTVPFGMGTEYDKNWWGANRGTNAKIYTFDMNPNIAWKVNDFLSVGAGVSVQYAKAELGMGMKEPGIYSGHGKVEADSWDWGFNLGIMISPTDKLRFGLAYRSAIEHDAEGDLKLSNVSSSALPFLNYLNGENLDMTTSIKTPDTVMLTGTWEATDQLRLSGLIRWANWSNFDELKLENEIPSGLGSLVPDPYKPLLSKFSEVSIQNDWQDTWLFSVGADYKINSAFTVRGGIAYETSPIDDQSTRMAVIPDTDRVWLSLGASWHATKDLQFDVGATYLMGVGDTDLYSATKEDGGTKVGKYDSLDAYLIGAQMQYRF